MFSAAKLCKENAASFCPGCPDPVHSNMLDKSTLVVEYDFKKQFSSLSYRLKQDNSIVSIVGPNFY